MAPQSKNWEDKIKTIMCSSGWVGRPIDGTTSLGRAFTLLGSQSQGRSWLGMDHRTWAEAQQPQRWRANKGKHLYWPLGSQTRKMQVMKTSLVPLKKDQLACKTIPVPDPQQSLSNTLCWANDQSNPPKVSKILTNCLCLTKWLFSVADVHWEAGVLQKWT